MAIEKVVIETIVCDKDGKKGKEDDGWVKAVVLQLGDAKWKGDLCPTCYAKVKAFRDDFLEGVEDAITSPAGDYDPKTDPRMKKLADDKERDFHYAAKLWAVGLNSTMKANDKPTGVRGPANEKTLDAYRAYLAAKAPAGKQPAPA